jgi:hypothetical protein
MLKHGEPRKNARPADLQEEPSALREVAAGKRSLRVLLDTFIFSQKRD